MIKTALALLCLVSSVTAAADAKLAYQACAACHGANGEGNAAIGAPQIAGQNQEYLLRQLIAFKEGARENDSSYAKVMSVAVTELGSDEIAPLSQYIASMNVTSKNAEKSKDSNLRNGENLYNANCGACHGSAGKGNPRLGAPKLAGMDTAYLLRQYTAFKNGKRGGAESGRYGKQMAMMAKAVGDKGLSDTLDYLQAQD